MDITDSVITNCQAGNPSPEACSQQTRPKLILALKLLKEGMRLCHVTDPWTQENTNCVGENTIEQLNFTDP
jgi:hypothetical protein